MKKRWDQLHTVQLVETAKQIKKLAEGAKQQTLKMTQYDIAKEIKEDPQMVALALRLTYTAEFMEEYGWGFIPPGSGRDGSLYGYALLRVGKPGNVETVLSQLDYTNLWQIDHARGVRAHFLHFAVALDGTETGDQCHRYADMMVGAIALMEQIAADHGDDE